MFLILILCWRSRFTCSGVAVRAQGDVARLEVERVAALCKVALADGRLAEVVEAPVVELDAVEVPNGFERGKP
jgi:hypothetical protein